MEPTLLLNNYNLIVSWLKSEKVQQISNLKSPEAKIRFIVENEAFWPLHQNLTKLKRNTQGKDKAISKSLRDSGNDEFKNEQDGAALDYYNQAVLLAPCNSNGIGEDLAIALANRAAVLLRQEKFTYCLNDLQLADRSGYPSHLRYKLLQRHAKAAAEMYRFSEAEAKLKEALQTIKDSKLNVEQRKQVTRDIEKSLAEAKKNRELEKAVQDFMKNPSQGVPIDMRLEKLTITGNDSYPSYISDVSVAKENKAMSVKALKDLKASTIIGLEEPLGHLLNAAEQLSYCSKCTAPVMLPVPCQGCIDIVYCSAECRDQAWNLYHKYECQLVGASSIFGENVLLAFRLFCQHWNDVEKLKKEIQLAKIEREYDDQEDIVLLAVSALLIRHLRRESFFDSQSKELSNEDLEAMQILADFFPICEIRSQPISEVESWDAHRGITLKEKGRGYYTFLTSLKHSCDPNTARVNIGTQSFLIATKRIFKNEDITYSYQVHFHRQPISERESILRQNFKVHCDCQACIEAWPTNEGLTKTVIRKGMEKFAPDLKRSYATVLTNSAQDLQAGYYDKVFSGWSSYYEKLDKVVRPPHQGFLRIAREIEGCAWLKYGSHRPKLKAPVYKDHTKSSPHEEEDN